VFELGTYLQKNKQTQTKRTISR